MTKNQTPAKQAKNGLGLKFNRVSGVTVPFLRIDSMAGCFNGSKEYSEMIKNQGRKFRRECGVSEFQLIAEGVLPKEVYAANPKAFDDELDRHFKEMWQWLSK